MDVTSSEGTELSYETMSCGNGAYKSIASVECANSSESFYSIRYQIQNQKWLMSILGSTALTTLILALGLNYNVSLKSTELIPHFDRVINEQLSCKLDSCNKVTVYNFYSNKLEKGSIIDIGASNTPFVSSYSKKISKQIQRSQENACPNMDKYVLRFMHSARKFAFESFTKNDLSQKKVQLMYIIEAYDITNGLVRGEIGFKNDTVFYTGQHTQHQFSISKERQIDLYMSNAFLSNKMDTLLQPFSNSSTIYIGTKVEFNDKLVFKHFKW
jgi:hypothetical protein